MLAAAVGVALIGLLTPAYRLQDMSWLESFAAAVAFVSSCAGLGWFVWRLLQRQPDGRHWAGAAVVHVLVAFVFSLLWTLVFSGFAHLIRPRGAVGWLHEGSVWQFVWGFIIYGALAQAARAHALLRERAVAAAGAELQALRAQLNPHFLFNTLHSLTQLAREDPVATEQALEQFGELMRYVLSAGREASADVALEDEIGFLRNYLALERLRLGGRLRVIEEIDPEALELAVPALLLQPLVENAVRHGISPRLEGGTLRLRARLEEDMLAFEVADDGAGAEPEGWRSSTGLGLKAVRRQLQARCSDGVGLAIATGPQAGFAVRFAIPARLPGAADFAGAASLRERRP